MPAYGVRACGLCARRDVNVCRRGVCRRTVHGRELLDMCVVST